MNVNHRYLVNPARASFRYTPFLVHDIDFDLQDYIPIEDLVY